MPHTTRAAAAIVLFLLTLTAAAPGAAARETPADTAAALRREALDLAYNLDRPDALVRLDRAIQLEPDHPANHRLIATLAWLRMLWDRGVVTVDDYLGTLATSDVAMTQGAPQTELLRSYTTHLEAARDRAARRLAQAPDDPQALYEMGAVYGLETSFHASIEGRMLKSFGLARKAFAAHARALSRDPARADAGYYVGSYRCIVAELNAPTRWLAYLGGLRGGKEEGLALLEAAAAHPGEAQGQARYTLVLIYNRDRRYADALRILDEVRRLYPRNRQFQYEAAATRLRAGQPAVALELLNTGIEALQTDARPRWLGEEAQWYHKRGLALRQLQRWDEARRDLQASLQREGRGWLKGRTHLELGRIADATGDRAAALREYQQAVAQCTSDPDKACANDARRALRTPFAPQPPAPGKPAASPSAASQPSGSRPDTAAANATR